MTKPWVISESAGHPGSMVKMGVTFYCVFTCYSPLHSETPPPGTSSGLVNQGQVCLEDTGLDSHWSWSNRIGHEDRRL